MTEVLRKAVCSYSLWHDSQAFTYEEDAIDSSLNCTPNKDPLHIPSHESFTSSFDESSSEWTCGSGSEQLHTPSPESCPESAPDFLPEWRPDLKLSPISKGVTSNLDAHRYSDLELTCLSQEGMGHLASQAVTDDALRSQQPVSTRSYHCSPSHLRRLFRIPSPTDTKDKNSGSNVPASFSRRFNKIHCRAASKVVPYARSRDDETGTCDNCGEKRKIAGGILTRHIAGCSGDAMGFVCMHSNDDGLHCLTPSVLSSNSNFYYSPSFIHSIASNRGFQFTKHCKEMHSNDFESNECQWLAHVRLRKADLTSISSRRTKKAPDVAATRRERIITLLKSQGYSLESEE